MWILRIIIVKWVWMTVINVFVFFFARQKGGDYLYVKLKLIKLNYILIRR